MKANKQDKRRGFALKRIQRHFPQVKSVVDATEGLLINVTEKDNKDAVPGDTDNCALAKAAVRERQADGAIIGVAYSWLIRGTKATRYKTSNTVGREITSFDRHHDFATGQNYRLSPVSPANRLGQGRSTHPNLDKGRGEIKPIVHRTARIREMWKK